jgi:hypothetical protein
VQRCQGDPDSSASSGPSPGVSIIVPAHDEEAVVLAGLEALLRKAEPGEFDVVVVCNGCRDATAATARSFGHPDVRVIELDIASKQRALEVGDELARGEVRLYVDADVRLDTASARRLVSALDTDVPRFAVPVPRRDLDGAAWIVRSFYRTWTALPASTGWESGVYGVSAAGHARLVAGRGPADDLTAVLSFAPEERLIVTAAVTSVRVPRTLRDLVRVRTRVRAGAMESALTPLDVGPRSRSRGSALGDVVDLVRRRPSRCVDAVVYCGIAAAAEIGARRVVANGGLSATWLRDESSRVSAP